MGPLAANQLIPSSETGRLSANKGSPNGLGRGGAVRVWKLRRRGLIAQKFFKLPENLRRASLRRPFLLVLKIGSGENRSY